MLRSDLIDRALFYKGLTYDKDNNIIFNTEYYNKKLNAKRAYCCVFVWYIYHKLNLAKLFYGGKKTASCTTLLNYYRSNFPQKVYEGKRLDEGKRLFRKGDIVFYQFDEDSASDHTGLFIANIDSNYFYAIEGNTSKNGSQSNGGYVEKKKRSYKKVMAIVHMPIEEGTCPYIEPVTAEKGLKGSGASWVQWYLNHNGYRVDIDGSYGGKTRDAVKEFQKNVLIKVTGKVDELTKTLLKGV